MLSQKTRAIAVAMSLLFSINAHAGFVETDWLVAGDKKATLHQETGLEWLDLTVTGGKTINEVKAMLSTSLAGWRMPTFNEIKGFAAAMAPIASKPRVSLRIHLRNLLSCIQHAWFQYCAPLLWAVRT